jgi:hypothetical protein
MNPGLRAARGAATLLLAVVVSGCDDEPYDGEGGDWQACAAERACGLVAPDRGDPDLFDVVRSVGARAGHTTLARSGVRANRSTITRCEPQRSR